MAALSAVQANVSPILTPFSQSLVSRLLVAAFLKVSLLVGMSKLLQTVQSLLSYQILLSVAVMRSE